MIYDYVRNNETRENFKSINERSLLSGLIENFSTNNHARLGYLISKSDYPVPVLYHLVNPDDKSIEYKVNFDLLSEVLSHSNKCLAIISGTTKTVYKGKSNLIPLFFPGLNNESISKLDEPSTSSYVDVLCNDENNEDWIIADFHGKVETNECKNLLKSFSSFANLHVLNVTIDDFNNNYEPSGEIQNLLSWYEDNNNTALLVILIRDMDAEVVKNKFANNVKVTINNIKMKSIQFYKEVLVHYVFNISNQVCGPERGSEKRRIAKELSEITKDITKPNNIVISKISIERKYMELMGENIHESKVDSLENKYSDLFTLKLNDVKEIFALSNLNRRIGYIQNEKKQAVGIPNNRNNMTKLEKEEDKLEREKFKLKLYNKYIKQFINLILKEDNSSLLKFEKHLLKIKSVELEKLNKNRKIESAKFISLQKQIQDNEKVQNFNNQSGQYKQLLKDKQISSKALKEIDDNIEDYNLTIGKFFDEIFLIIDWNEDEKKLEKENEILQIKDDFIEKVVELINKGNPIHLLRGRPLKVESKVLESVFDKLSKYENIFVISIIGQQSSAKSSLLNALFGCDFHTSAGRCTIGIYLNFVKYKDKTIVIFDTEGLMSVETNDKIFDHQMTTMALFSSHLILINTKNESDANLANLLGVSFYAKLINRKCEFKPSIMFVIRDQDNLEEKHVQKSVEIIKEKLTQETSKINQSVENVINIDTKNVKLLPDAFSRGTLSADMPNRKYKKRNFSFSEEILLLRRKLIEEIENLKNIDNHHFTSMSDFYEKISNNWSTIESISDNLLNFKNLEELRVYKEISLKTEKFIDVIKRNLIKAYDELFEEKKKKIAKDFSEEKADSLFHELKEWFQGEIIKYFTSYKNEINNPNYSVSLKNQFENNLKNSLNFLEERNLNRWKSVTNILNNFIKLNETKRQLHDEFKILLNSSNNLNDLKLNLEDKFSNNRTKFLNDIQKKYLKDDDLIHGLLYKYNISKDVLGRNTFLEMAPHIERKHLEEFRKKPFLNRNFQEWNKYSNESDNKVELLKSNIYKNAKMEIKSQIGSNYDFDDADIRRVLSNVFEKTFHIEIDTTQINMEKVVEDMIKFCLSEILESLKINRDKAKKEELTEYENNCRKMKIDLNKDFESKKNSKLLGIRLIEKLFDELFELILVNELTDVGNKIEKKMNDLLKSPQNVVELAYKESFESRNYENVYKYVVDIERYCNEIIHRLTYPQICSILLDNNFKIRTDFNELLKHLRAFDFRTITPGYKLHDVIQKIIDSIKKSENLRYFEDFFENLSIHERYENVEISSLEEFKDGLIEEISKKGDKLDNLIDNFDLKIKKEIDVKLKHFSKFYLGCTSVCPFCDSKCNLGVDHENDHSCFRHIYVGFGKIRDPSTHFVWIKEIYCYEKTLLEISFTDTDTETQFKTFRNYLQEKNPKWLNNIENMALNFGNLPINHIENSNMKSAWMNTRKAILKHFNTIGWNINDQPKYPTEWSNLEDEEKLLKEDHQPTWLIEN
jgi:hypothetical protein